MYMWYFIVHWEFNAPPLAFEWDFAGLGKALFDTGSTDALRPDIVSLPAFEQDGWWYKDFTDAGHNVDVKQMLRVGFGCLSGTMTHAPPLLAAVVPPFAVEVDDPDAPTSFYLQQLLRVDWGDGCIDLSGCFEDMCPERHLAKYRLVAFVEYVGEVDIVPSSTLVGGHFVAYFSEGGRWHRADDSVVGDPGVLNEHGFPKSFPYICIMQRLCVDAVDAWLPNCDVQGVAAEKPPPKRPLSEPNAEDAPAIRRPKRMRTSGKQAPPKIGRLQIAACKQKRRNRLGQQQQQDTRGRRRQRDHSEGEIRPDRSRCPQQRVRLWGKQRPPKNRSHQIAACQQARRRSSGPQQQRDRKSRQQVRPSRQQNRPSRQQDRTSRQQDRTQQDRKGRQQDRQQDRTQRLREHQDELRRMRSRPCGGDNADSSRQDPQSLLYLPFARNTAEQKQLETAAVKRFEDGCLLLLMHLLDSEVDVDALWKDFPDCFCYVGLDCREDWAQYLHEVSRASCVRSRLAEALGVTQGEVEDAKAILNKQKGTSK